MMKYRGSDVKTVNLYNMPTPEATGFAASHSEEIKSIAHEYGVLLAKDIPLSNCLKNEVINSTEDYIVEFLQWLSKDYCIVPKSKVKASFNDIRDNSHGTIFWRTRNDLSIYADINDIKDEFCDLFGTELFNEEKG